MTAAWLASPPLSLLVPLPLLSLSPSCRSFIAAAAAASPTPKILSHSWEVNLRSWGLSLGLCSRRCLTDPAVSASASAFASAAGALPRHAARFGSLRHVAGAMPRHTASLSSLRHVAAAMPRFLAFGAFKASRFAPAEPVMPPRLFSNRTSLIIGINTFLFNVVIYWAIFFLPVYFKSVKLTSPTRAGINVIPVALLGAPAPAAAAAVSRCGKYKIIHILSFTLFTAGLALFARLDKHSPTGEWVGYMVP